MTCIVGLVENGVVYIGGDSSAVSGWHLLLRKDRKVFRVGDVLLGFTSSFRLGQLLRDTFRPPVVQEDEDIERYMTTTFINAVRECLKEGGFAQKKNEQESAGTFLVGFRGRLFRIADDYQVGETLHNYDAVGSGESVALGSLYTTAHFPTPLPPSTRIELALAAAEQHNIGVRGPFYWESIERTDEQLG
jgi:ATP-dependent protease HslVU (ClpYQ) peptidase subunit